jgi:hypothetical protein
MSKTQEEMETDYPTFQVARSESLEPSDQKAGSIPACHRERPDVILVAVTSQTANPAVTMGDLTIEQWNEAGLLKPSQLID